MDDLSVLYSKVSRTTTHPPISNGDENLQTPNSLTTKVTVNVNIHDKSDKLLGKASGTYSLFINIH